MSTVDRLFAQIFDTKKRIIDQVKEQIESYDRQCAAKLLIRGIRPPPWLLDSVQIRDDKDVRKDELIPGILLSCPRPSSSFLPVSNPNEECHHLIENSEAANNFLEPDVVLNLAGRSSVCDFRSDLHETLDSSSSQPGIRRTGSSEIFPESDKPRETFQRSKSRQREMLIRSSSKAKASKLIDDRASEPIIHCSLRDYDKEEEQPGISCSNQIEVRDSSLKRKKKKRESSTSRLIELRSSSRKLNRPDAETGMEENTRRSSMNVNPVIPIGSQASTEPRNSNNPSKLQVDASQSESASKLTENHEMLPPSISLFMKPRKLTFDAEQIHEPSSDTPGKRDPSKEASVHDVNGASDTAMSESGEPNAELCQSPPEIENSIHDRNGASDTAISQSGAPNAELYQSPPEMETSIHDCNVASDTAMLESGEPNPVLCLSSPEMDASIHYVNGASDTATSESRELNAELSQSQSEMETSIRECDRASDTAVSESGEPNADLCLSPPEMGAGETEISGHVSGGDAVPGSEQPYGEGGAPQVTDIPRRHRTSEFPTSVRSRRTSRDDRRGSWPPYERSKTDGGAGAGAVIRDAAEPELEQFMMEEPDADRDDPDPTGFRFGELSVVERLSILEKLCMTVASTPFSQALPLTPALPPCSTPPLTRFWADETPFKGNSRSSSGRRVSSNPGHTCFPIKEEECASNVSVFDVGVATFSPASTSSMNTAVQTETRGKGASSLMHRTSGNPPGLRSISGMSMKIKKKNKNKNKKNIVSTNGISSFVSLIQQKHMHAPFAGKRDVKVKALEVAEAAKRMEQQREHERKMKKEAMRIERARVDEQRRKEVDDCVMRKRTREEKERKVRQQRLQATTLRAQPRDDQASRTAVVQRTNGKTVTPSASFVQREESYELSPYNGSDDDDDEHDDDVRMRKHVPSWCRKSLLGDALLFQHHIDPSKIFPRKSFRRIILGPR